MTTISKNTVRCAVCGTMSRHTVVQSTNAFGAADLDFRPPGMQRATIIYWVQRCPNCGYCNSNLSNALPRAAAGIKTLAYRSQLKNRNYPELANSFLCQAMLEIRAGRLPDAAWTSISAAWICDDKRLPKQATGCRKKAIMIMDKMKTQGRQLMKEPGGTEAVLVDLLRRAGLFERARRVIKTALKKKYRPEIENSFQLQLKLVELRDTTRHTFAEVLVR